VVQSIDFKTGIMIQDLSKVKRVVMHCSATKPHQNIGVKEIRNWHVAGNGWRDVGYHVVVRRDGSAEKGRPIYEAPAANGAGNNMNTVAICWVGGIDDKGYPEDNRTDEQKKTLMSLKKILDVVLDNPEYLGHRDLPNVNKACPCFDVKKEFA
jgi:N-acetylmuramoyl-L-alanine amidase